MTAHDLKIIKEAFDFIDGLGVMPAAAARQRYDAACKLATLLKSYGVDPYPVAD
jgi:hypothetical protein